MISTLIKAVTPTTPGVISELYQVSRMPPTAGDEAGDRIGCDAMGVDVEAERIHPARVVADALQRDAERRADQVADEEIAGERAASAR